QKAAIIAQVGQIYSDAVGQYYIGADTKPRSGQGGMAVVVILVNSRLCSYPWVEWSAAGD
ncbi:hypothetical protein, partial [Achromobacter ruhlandii]|uniref:hypothetical protein n=1 Tax=Achromobacter ruhlandii TaxID=72557 RepID=UPI0022B8AAB8